jgi:hypothetical protein
MQGSVSNISGKWAGKAEKRLATAAAYPSCRHITEPFRGTDLDDANNLASIRRESSGSHEPPIFLLGRSAPIACPFPTRKRKRVQARSHTRNGQYGT